MMREDEYTVGQDHEGTWWLITPGGTEGYPLPTERLGREVIIAIDLSGGLLTPVDFSLDAADPPPELVGGPGLDDEVFVTDGLVVERAAMARRVYWSSINELDRALTEPSPESLLAWVRVVEALS